MATIFKRLTLGTVISANTTTTIYTTPTSNKTIIKSFIITNTSSSSVTVIVRLANLEIAFNYIIKPYDTIVIPAMDQILLASNTISIYATAANSINYYISGIETLTTDSEYAEVSRMGFGVITSEYGTIVTTSSKNRLVKGIILCNTNSADSKVTLGVSGYSVLHLFTIKGYDTILVPTTDLFIPASTTISASGGGVNYYITGKELD